MKDIGTIQYAILSFVKLDTNVKITEDMLEGTTQNRHW